MRLALVPVLCAFLATSQGAFGATGVEVARGEAEANARTPAGRSYEGVVISRVEVWLKPAIQRCARTLPKDDLVGFDGLIRVGVDGKAEEFVLRPETALARCVAPEFREASYPRPPRPSWWVKVEIRPR